MTSDDAIRSGLTPGQHALYQWTHLVVDFAAALMFVSGSIFFLYPGFQDTGSWLFLIGSLFFAMKPTIRLMRFLHIRRLARRAEQSLVSLL
jgi:hypothetical protein